MAFTPGISGNPNGRPAGIPNGTTAELRTFIQQFINGNLDTIQADYNTLEPKDRLAFIEKLLKYVVPRQMDATVQAFDIKQIVGMNIL